MACGPTENANQKIASNPSTYEELLTLFKEFREFQAPKMTNGVPDYTATAMQKQWNGLKEFQNRLAAMNIEDWPIPQQVDYHIVRAEMNGLEFNHLVLRPWSRDPCFYLQSQSGAGPVIHGAFRVPRSLPMDEERLAEFKTQLRALPEIFDQAKTNLTDGEKDLTTIAIWGTKEESEEYAGLAEWLKDYHPELVEDALKAKTAVDDYGQWLQDNREKMTAPSGVGKENYTWWLKNVHLFPYTWEECRDFVQLEDYRVRAFLKLEENRNKNLPPLLPVDTKEEHARRKKEALEYVMKFLEDEKIMTIPEYLETHGYLNRGGIPREQKWPRDRDFFQQTGDREPLPEQTHEFIGHYFDHQRHRRDTRPIRGARRLYEVDWIRSEGFAFALEELLMHAGYLDERPRPDRGREIVYLQAAFRRCRAMADLKLHSHEFNLEQAMKYCVECAPNRWLLDNGPHVRYEMQTTLRFVGWHMGMVMGKIQFIKFLTDRAEQLGDKFELGQFIDEYLAAGMIPMSLIRWEMTGLDDEMKELLAE
jgi:hypothetical protein